MSRISRELALWADFNSVDADRRFVASFRFATTADRPIEGERIRLYDDEGNSVVGVVEQVDGILARVRPDMSTWSSLDISVTSPFARNRSRFRATVLEIE